ncbi:MAG: hypothetical protein LBQ49_02170 [Rickettsiales bacterium]|jgi:hypothetical protein|nr:hypothetical protein [Rickettsiales bacterium]
MTQLELWDDSDAQNSARKADLKLFVNDDDDAIAEYRLARRIYAETLGKSLAAAEALAVMARNTGRGIADIAEDENVFESLCPDSARHADLRVDSKSPQFQMCLRAVRNMAGLPDKIFGATRFHRDDIIPDWASGIGSVAEVDGLLFYN